MSDLTAFPMDSQVTGMGDDGLPVYDRAFDSTDLREVYKTYFSNGYFAEVGTSMHVKAATGMTATVEAGKVNIQGTLGFMTEDATVTFAAAGSAARIDTVVARLDLSVEKRVIELDVLKGEEGVTTAPGLTRDSTVWELGLADVTIPANSTAIKDENVKDTRLDTTRCGVVNPFAKLDTDSLFTQVTAIIAKAGEDTTANIERLESEVDAAIKAEQDKTAAAIAKAETDVANAIADARSDIDVDVAKLDKATADAVSAMNDALSSTVLGSVWRLGSSSSADYLAYGDDLNNISGVCTRFCESASVAGGVANRPTGEDGPFAVYTFATEQDPSRLGQVFLSCDSSGVRQYMRSGAGTSWTEWATVGGADQTARNAAKAAQETATAAKTTAEGVHDHRPLYLNVTSDEQGEMASSLDGTLESGTYLVNLASLPITDTFPSVAIDGVTEFPGAVPTTGRAVLDVRNVVAADGDVIVIQELTYAAAIGSDSATQTMYQFRRMRPSIMSGTWTRWAVIPTAYNGALSSTGSLAAAATTAIVGARSKELAESVLYKVASGLEVVDNTTISWSGAVPTGGQNPLLLVLFFSSMRIDGGNVTGVTLYGLALAGKYFRLSGFVSGDRVITLYAEGSFTVTSGTGTLSINSLYAVAAGSSATITPTMVKSATVYAGLTATTYI